MYQLEVHKRAVGGVLASSATGDYTPTAPAAFEGPAAGSGARSFTSGSSSSLQLRRPAAWVLSTSGGTGGGSALPEGPPSGGSGDAGQQQRSRSAYQC
jgi:hypothetical protein